MSDRSDLHSEAQTERRERVFNGGSTGHRVFCDAVGTHALVVPHICMPFLRMCSPQCQATLRSAK